MVQANAESSQALLRGHVEAVEEQQRAQRTKRIKVYDKDPQYSDPDLYPMEERACNKLACGNCKSSSASRA